MPNTIKYSTSPQTLALKKGNFWIGTGDTDKGPTVTTDYWNGITPPPTGYTVYLNKASNGPSIFTPATDSDLIVLTQTLSGQTFATGPSALNWYNTQTDKMVFNIDYPAIVTNGLIFNLDSGFTPSYPKYGTSWYDLSSNGYNTSLLNGPTFSATGGGSILFDGTDDYGLTPVINHNIGNGDFSYSFWVYPTGLKASGATIASFIGNSEYSPTFGFDLNGFPNQLGYYWGGWKGFGSNPGLNQWNHVVMTRSGTLVTGYLNGVACPTTYTDGQNMVNSQNVIGRSGVNYAPDTFKGAISIAQIYNKSLSSSEVLQNYQSALPRFFGQNIVTSGLAYLVDAGYKNSYPGSGTSWFNIAGTTGGTGALTNGPTYSSTNGGSIVFDGVDDYVNVPAYNRVFTTLTLGCWIQLNGAQASFAGIIFSRGGGGSTTGLNFIGTQFGGNGFKLGFHYNDGGFTTPGPELRSGSWTQVYLVFSQSGTFFYINGSLAFSTGSLVSSTRLSGLRLGLDPDSSSRVFKGNMAMAQIYSKALSASEVFQNYQGTLPRMLGENIVTNGMVAYWDAGFSGSYGGTGTSWYNISGIAGATGALTNGPTYATGNGGALVFDGSDDFVNVPNIPSLNLGTNSFSVNVWIYLFGLPTGESYPNCYWIFGTGPQLSITNTQLFVGKDRIHFDINTDNGGPIDVNHGFSINTWYNICVTRTGNIFNIYKNGVLLQTASSSQSAVNTYDWAIGKPEPIPSGTIGYFYGRIALLSIYNSYSLTQTEVTQNYNAQKGRFGL